MFADFVPFERITGEVLPDAIISRLTGWGLSLADLRGQCCDGSSHMSGARSGCKSIVQWQAPMATYSHCAAHQLNLAVVSACKIQAFKNTESTIGEMARFSKFSAKRQRFLEKALDLVTPATYAKKLKDACRTRWIQHMDSYTVFLELLPAVHTALQAMSKPIQGPWNRLVLGWRDPNKGKWISLPAGVFFILGMFQNPFGSLVIPQKPDTKTPDASS